MGGSNKKLVVTKLLYGFKIQSKVVTIYLLNYLGLEIMMIESQLAINAAIIASLFRIVLSFCPDGCDCRHRFGGKVDLHCENSNMTNFVVASKTYTSINSIHLSGNCLESFNGSKVSMFSPNLSMLDLKTNDMKEVNKGTFKGLLELKLLDISNNNIGEINSEAFGHLSKLNTLHMRNNKIKVVKDIWFRSLSELMLIDLRQNLINRFQPSYFVWPSNLKTLLLQGNSFHVIPPLPKNPHLVDLSDNKIDCSCQRVGQEKVNKDVLLKVTVICNKISTEKWRKMHWENPFCTFPTVRVDYKEFDDIYIVNCTGDGFPLPKVFFKHKGHVAVRSLKNSQVIYSINNDTNITCEARSPVGNIESHLMGKDEQEEGDSPISVKCKNTSDNTQEDISCKCSVLSLGYYTTMFISCVFTISALVVCLYIFSISFRQLESPDNET